MPDVQIPAWLVPVVLAIGGTIGWFVRKLFERRWAKKDRFLLRGEADLEKQLRLLRKLNGELHQKWIWLGGHTDAHDLEKAEPVADEIYTWCYKHSAHFPEKIQRRLVGLGNLTSLLATEGRAEWLNSVPIRFSRLCANSVPNLGGRLAERRSKSYFSRPC